MSNLSSEKIKIQKTKYQMSKKDKKKSKKKEEEKKKKKALKKDGKKKGSKKDKKLKKKGKSQKKSKKELKDKNIISPEEKMPEVSSVVKKVTPRKLTQKKVIRKIPVNKQVVEKVSEEASVKLVGSMAMTSKEAIVKIRAYKTLGGLLNFVKTENRSTVLKVAESKKNQLSKK